jgi:hypothetical protein
MTIFGTILQTELNRSPFKINKKNMAANNYIEYFKAKVMHYSSLYEGKSESKVPYFFIWNINRLSTGTYVFYFLM